MAPRFTLAELASRVGGRVRGDPSTAVSGLRPLDEAGPEDLSFLGGGRYRKVAASSRAGALLTSDRLAPPEGNLLLVDDPHLALAELLPLFHTEPPLFAGGISPNAVVSPSARIGREVAIGPLAVVGDGCELGDRVRIHPGAVLGAGCSVGEDTVLHPCVGVYPGTRIGRRVIVHGGAVLGSDGFGFATTRAGHRKIPQVGRLVVEDDVEIGANVTIDRGSLGDTVIGRGTKIDNLVQVAHNVRVGEECLLVAQSGIAGSTRLGRRVTVAGQAGAAGHLSLGDGVVVASKSAVYKDLEKGSYVAGIPAIDHTAWKRAQAAIARLPELRAEVRSLRRRLAELERLLVRSKEI